MTDEVNYELIYGMIGVALCSALFVSLWTWAASSERYRKYRLSGAVRDPLATTNKFKQISMVLVFDIILYSGFLILAYDWLIQDRPIDWLTMIGQILATFLIYDFLFYWVHRLFHQPYLMRRVHRIHHRVRVPKAIDDFYLHPIDSLWVTTLFFQVSPSWSR